MAAPDIAGVLRDRHDRDAGLLRKGRRADAVLARLAARHAGAFREDRDPSTLGKALLALLDLARRQRDEEAIVRGYLALSDANFGGGLSELYALLRGDALGSKLDAGSATAYTRALDEPSTATAAAVSLLSLPTKLTDADQRLAAEEVLLEADAERQEQDGAFSNAYGALRAALGEPSSSTEDAWVTLSALAPNEELRAATLLQGLRAAALAKLSLIHI